MNLWGVRAFRAFTRHSHNREFVLWRGCRHALKRHEPDVRVLRGRRHRLTLLPKVRAPEFPLHVRLTAANPHIADRDVLEFDRVLSFDLQRVAGAGLLLAELSLPLAVLVGFRART